MGAGVLLAPDTHMYIYNQFGEKIDMGDVSAVNEIVRIKKKSGSNPWPVIELCIKIWESKRPSEWKAFLVELGEVKQTRRDRHAATKSKSLRYLLDLPETLVYMIRKVYSSEELPMNREFLREFARRYPKFAVPQSL